MSPKGFWSYAKDDDGHLDGRLSQLRERIAGEVSLLLGHEIGIFQDIHDLRTGDDWAATLRVAISDASFLIPVLTPRFFNRPWCREEVLTYLRICTEKRVAPRIFPIRFVEWEDDETCEVRAALQPYQYKDLSQWRFESDPTQRERLIHEFAKDVKAKLRIAPVPQPAPKPGPKVAERGSVAPTPVPKPDTGPKYQTYTVDPFPGRGDFTTIGAAINQAAAGSRIVVHEGTYRESLHLSKPLEIVGEGDRERIVVVTDKGNVLRCDAPMARISGLRFRREAGGNAYSVWIQGGAAEIDDCVFESLSHACIAISGVGTSPSLRRCVMRNGATSGLYVYDGAQPVIEDCETYANRLAGVEVNGASTRVTLRRCIARDGKMGGYFLQKGAGGDMEQCTAYRNTYSGIEISTGANPNLRDCILRDNRQAGLIVCETGQGRLQACEITGNANSGIFVREGGMPDVTGCTISGNAEWAVEIEDAESGGVFRGNDLRGNGRSAWNVAEGAKLERSDNKG